MRRIRHLIEAAVFGLLLGVTRVLPRRAVRALGRFLGSVAGRLNRRHQAIALENLRGALPELTPEETLAIARRCWRHFGEILLDTLTFWRLGPGSKGREVHYRGLEHVRDAYAAGKGAVQFTGHFGHWELIGLMQGHLGMPMSVVARPLDNPFLERMLASVRGSSGNTVVYKRNAVRAMMKAIRKGTGAGILIDQDARSAGIFVPFFGRMASTTPTLALLAVRTGAPVLPMHSEPGPGGSWIITYEPPIQVDLEADRDREILRITAHCTAMLERWIRARPELWLWMHRRWKTRPPGETFDTAKGVQHETGNPRQDH